MKKITFLFLFFIFSINAFAADEWNKASPAGTINPSTLDTVIAVNNEALDRLLSSYRRGLVLSYSSASALTVSAGEATCSKSDGSIRKMRLNTAGSVSFSDIDIGSEAASTTYYVYAVADADATTATFKISTSSASPTGATYYLRLGSFYNDSSSNISMITNDNIRQIKAYSSKTDSVVYQALTDGFICAYGPKDGGSTVSGYTDSANPPTTLIASQAGFSSSAYNVYISFPVKAGDYWKTVGATSVLFVPLSE